MDLKQFYFQNIQNSEYHYCFYNSIKNLNRTRYGEVEDYGFKVYDTEEAITKFKGLCQPEKKFSTNEERCWFYLITYYLHKMGYEIKEFPRVLARPPQNPEDFTYGEIRNTIIARGGDDKGTVTFKARRNLVSSFTFNLKSSHIDIDNSINQKFIEISNRRAPFNNMSIDERLAEIANLIENLLKKNGKFITPDYSKICFNYISNDIVTDYRKKIQCFRHAANESIVERNSYSEDQKNFLVDYGLTIVKVIYSLLKEK